MLKIPAFTGAITSITSKIEGILAKKRTILGVDPADYSMEEFEKIISPKIVEHCQNKIANIDRHLKANIKSYQDLILQYGDEIKTLSEKDYEEIINNDDDAPYYTNEICKEILLYDLLVQTAFCKQLKKIWIVKDWELKTRALSKHNIISVRGG